jgi:hypothetical protein
MSLFNTILVIGVAALANTALPEATAQQVSRTGSFELPCSTDTAFPLFSPEGERDWVKGWDPRPVFPDRIVFSRDTVFKQGEAEEEAVWTIVDVDPQIHRAEYVRLAPASHTAHIVVRVEPLGPERSRVVVSYTVTAFGEHATSILDAFSESAYATKMRSWQEQISAYLEKHSKDSPLH